MWLLSLHLFYCWLWLVCLCERGQVCNLHHNLHEDWNEVVKIEMKLNEMISLKCVSESVQLKCRRIWLDAQDFHSDFHSDFHFQLWQVASCQISNETEIERRLPAGQRNRGGHDFVTNVPTLGKQAAYRSATCSMWGTSLHYQTRIEREVYK